MPFLFAHAQEWRGVYSLYDFDAPVDAVEPPKGYNVVYLSHYGRHGARYIIKEAEYRILADVFGAAASADNLTANGTAFWRVFTADSVSFIGRSGDLSRIGAEEQWNLGCRYKKTFPRLFAKAGSVRAESSVVPRCIRSMYCFIEGCGMGADAHTICEVDASHMHYMSVHSPFHYAGSVSYLPLTDVLDTQSITGRCFKDSCKALNGYDVSEFIISLFYFCAHQLCIGLEDELTEIIFTPEELAVLSGLDNRKFHFNCGWECPENVWEARALLKIMLEQARTDMASGDVKVRLRFGHDGTIMKLMSLLGFAQWSSARWNSSEVCMASNICIVFAKNREGNTLVQVRFNEHDMSGWISVDELYGKLQ